MKAAGGLRSAGTFPSVKPYSKPFNRNIMKQKKIRRQPQKKPSILKKLDEYKKQAAQQPKDKQKEQKKDLEV